MKLKLVVLVSGLAFAASANALTFSQAMVTQTFDSLSSTGTTNTWSNGTTISGFYGYRYAGSGAGNPQDVTQYIASDGTSNTGALFSMGNSADRALGVISSGSNVIEFGVKITNDKAYALKSVTVKFDGEQWRSSTTTQNKLDFAYSVDATSLSTGTWSDVNGLDVIGQTAVVSNGAITGGASLGSYSSLVTFTTPVAPGGSFWLRWQDVNDAGNDAMLGIDNLQVVPEPASMVALGLGAAALIRRRKV